MSFLRDHPTTMNHPDIIEFLKDCDAVRFLGCIDFEMMRSMPLIRYSDSLIVLRWDSDKKDFIYKYWGSNLTEVYGLELSGKYIADGKHGDTENPFIQAHLECIRDEKTIFLGGTIDWREKEYQSWNQVIQPLKRDGLINETITYVTFTRPND